MANRCPWALLPAGVYRAGTSRCRWCALTAPLHPCLCTGRGEPPTGPSAVCFCGTVLTVARTGRYPAGLAIGEPGLSSTGPGGRPEGCRHSDRDHLACFPQRRLAAAWIAPGFSEGPVGWGGPAGERPQGRASCQLRITRSPSTCRTWALEPRGGQKQAEFFAVPALARSPRGAWNSPRDQGPPARGGRSRW
jgi:hypothetical protein